MLKDYIFGLKICKILDYRNTKLHLLETFKRKYNSSSVRKFITVLENKMQSTGWCHVRSNKQRFLTSWKLRRETGQKYWFKFFICYWRRKIQYIYKTKYSTKRNVCTCVLTTRILTGTVSIVQFFYLFMNKDAMIAILLESNLLANKPK